MSLSFHPLPPSAVETLNLREVAPSRLFPLSRLEPPMDRTQAVMKGQALVTSLPFTPLFAIPHLLALASRAFRFLR